MTLIKKLLGFSIFIFFTASSYGQITNFNLQVEKTDETCPGNGSLSFSVSNVTPGASVIYKVYLLPNVTTPVAITESSSVTSLVSGNYKVVAIQALGNQSNSVNKTVTVNDEIEPFNYNININNQYCAAGGNIIINVTEGTASEYEIIDGPVIRPLQTTNVFEALPSGDYKIRVFNSCGVAKVKTYSLTIINSTLSIGDTYYSEIAPACDSLEVKNVITPSYGDIMYPITVQHRLSPMTITGESIVIDQEYISGNPNSLEVSAVVPRYAAESYSYEVSVTDNCATTYEKLDNVVNPSVGISLERGSMLCAQAYLKVSAHKVATPYTVEFLHAPPGFSAAAFNTAGNGPFYTADINYGNENMAVPFGTYAVKITDACGRTAQETIDIDFTPLEPHVIGIANQCFASTGRIEAEIDQQVIVAASIIDGPSGCNLTLPLNINSSITAEGKLFIAGLPIGMYKLTLTDNCGYTHTVEVEIPPYVDQDFEIYTVPDCTLGFGTVRFKSRNSNLVSVSVISAPAGYGYTLPHDVTNYIVSIDGDLYLNNLPEGNYTFKGLDGCGTERIMSKMVYGHIPPQENSVAFTPNCGTFSLKVMDTGNGTWLSSYWLQKFDPVTGTWGHPNGSSYGYVEGTEPTAQHGFELPYWVPVNNLVYSGSFRVLKKFEAYNNGSAEMTLCIRVLKQFTFDSTFTMTNGYTLACAGSPNDILIEATGYNLIYRIEKKNGERYVVENGSDNIFRNLELSATYLFSVEDNCGNKLTKELNLMELPSIAEATTPDDFVVCEELAGDITTYQFKLSDKNAEILGELHSAMYTITYHISQQDADNGVNALPEYYTPQQNGQTIYARLIHNEIGLCHGTTSFKLFVTSKPEPVITTTGTLCSGEGGVYLVAPDGFTDYLWSTGEITRSILVTEPGRYTVTVKIGENNRLCEGFAEVEVTESAAPEITDVQTQDWTDDQNMITVFATGMGNLLYSIDGENWQEDNVFTGLENGFYTVFVKDAGGCGMESREVTLLNYPKFFTPNGDGVNDTWRIRYSAKEPNMKINIFDRFGKIVSSFGSNHEGWNGTFNGEKLPSTDYWFVVTREDGRELKGHFAMIR